MWAGFPYTEVSSELSGLRETNVSENGIAVRILCGELYVWVNGADVV